MTTAKRNQDTEGGWASYVRLVKENCQSPQSIDHKRLMQQYISGIPWEEAVKSVNLDLAI